MTVTMMGLFLLFFQPTAPAASPMTTGGWLFMAGAWLAILVLVFYSFSKVLGKK